MTEMQPHQLLSRVRLLEDQERASVIVLQKIIDDLGSHESYKILPCNEAGGKVTVNTNGEAVHGYSLCCDRIEQNRPLVYFPVELSKKVRVLINDDQIIRATEGALMVAGRSYTLGFPSRR